jgi:hypothetical protein
MIYLYRLVLTRSRWPELVKANHFLAHLALLVAPEALFRPATAPKFPGGGLLYLTGHLRCAAPCLLRRSSGPRDL